MNRQSKTVVVMTDFLGVSFKEIHDEELLYQVQSLINQLSQREDLKGETKKLKVERFFSKTVIRDIPRAIQEIMNDKLCVTGREIMMYHGEFIESDRGLVEIPRQRIWQEAYRDDFVPSGYEFTYDDVA